MAQQLIPGIRGSALRADYEEPYHLDVPQALDGITWSYDETPYYVDGVLGPPRRLHPEHLEIFMFTDQTREELDLVHEQYYKAQKHHYFVSLDYLLVHTGVEWVKWDPDTPYPEPELWVEPNPDTGRQGMPMIGCCAHCFSAGKLGNVCQRCWDRPMLRNKFARYLLIWSKRDEYIYNPLFLMRLAQRKLYLPVDERLNCAEVPPYPAYPYPDNGPLRRTAPRVYPRNMFINDAAYRPIIARPRQRADNDLGPGELQAFADIEGVVNEWKDWRQGGMI